MWFCNWFISVFSWAAIVGNIDNFVSIFGVVYNIHRFEIYSISIVFFRTGDSSQNLRWPNERVSSVRWSLENGNILTTGCVRGKIVVWDVRWEIWSLDSLFQVIDMIKRLYRIFMKVILLIFNINKICFEILISTSFSFAYASASFHLGSFHWDIFLHVSMIYKFSVIFLANILVF